LDEDLPTDKNLGGQLLFVTTPLTTEIKVHNYQAMSNTERMRVRRRGTKISAKICGFETRLQTKTAASKHLC